MSYGFGRTLQQKSTKKNRCFSRNLNMSCRKRRFRGVPKVESALWVASEHGHLKVVQLLIDAEAHVDTCHSDDMDGQNFGAGIIRFVFELARG